MILADHEIRSFAERGMITPFEPSLLNPASLDVRLGSQLMIEVGDELNPYNLNNYTREYPFKLQPNQFVLAHTLEEFCIPDTLAAQFALKSSLARAGFEHLLAGWIDPGFNSSVLTLELKNSRQYSYLPLYPGMKIGQIIFMRMSSTPERSYKETGHYNGDKSVKACKVIL